MPPEFGVSPTFNIADLKPYLGEEDELESRTTPLQEGEDDEDISPMLTSDTPSVVMHGPLTRARARQLNQQVSSFLSSSLYTFEDSMLPNVSIDYILLRNLGEEHEAHGNQQGRGGKQGVRPSQVGGPILLGVAPLGLQEQSAPKSSPRPQTGYVFDEPHILGKIKT